MQKVIDQITDQLVGLIKKVQSSYTPQQLLKAGIPNYIVERIRLLLEDKVLSDLHEPSSVWIESNNELLRHAWEDFKTTAVSSSVIPHEQLYKVLYQTINDIISVFVEPRKNMAAYLFREETVLSFDEISKRCARLTIYKHFGKAIPLYMQKRDLNEITLERCQKLITNLDARIVANYTAENWAQKLELLFTLFGGKLDPKLLRLFFEDKGFQQAADMFSSIDVSVTQSTFIQMLSDKQINISEPKKVEIKTEIKEEVDTNSSKTEEVQKDDNDQEEILASTLKSEESDPDMNAILVDITDEGLVEEDNLEEAKSLNTLFISEDEEDSSEPESSFSKEEDQKELRTNLSSILGQAKDSYEGVVNESTEPDEIIVEDELIVDLVDEEVEAQEPQDSEVDEESAADEEKPMWAQFLSKDQMEVMMAKREDEPEESINDSLYVEDEDDELIIETQEETSETLPLIDYLQKDEKSWIKALFAGKDNAYSKAIQTMEQFDNWKQASEYVEENIFSKKEVDMFSEEAIEFIDALQTYFKEYKS